MSDVVVFSLTPITRHIWAEFGIIPQRRKIVIFGSA
jgi:hypothetical protein